jgi:hypothetical protein
MAGLARFAFMLMVLLFWSSVAGSASTDSGARTTIRPPSAMASDLQSHAATPPRRSASISEEKVLAWILLLMKEGRGAR